MSSKLERPAKELRMGARYGNLVVIDGPRRNERNSWEYKFRCEAKQEKGSICGKEFWKEKNRIKGRLSCGCLRGARTDLSKGKSGIGVEKEVPTNFIAATRDKKNEVSKPKRGIYGELIDFRGLQHAPVNEQGVVYLFGMISQELGYMIESVKTSYPDCEGKRCFNKGKNKWWERVNIEFEYKSSHFEEHKHDTTKCDVIVCWEDDWKDCPIQVVELREIIKSLKS